MTHTTTGAKCVFEPAGKRSAYIIVCVLITVGLCAIVAGLLGPAVAKPALQPYAEVSAHRIISTASHQT